MLGKVEICGVNTANLLTLSPDNFHPTGLQTNLRNYLDTTDMKSGKLYTFEQFADIFADVIYPGYNNFKASGERESPMERYLRLPKAKTIVPSWRTLAVLKKKKKILRSSSGRNPLRDAGR